MKGASVPPLKHVRSVFRVIFQSLTLVRRLRLPFAAHRFMSSSRASGSSIFAACRGGMTAPTRTLTCIESTRRSSFFQRGLCLFLFAASGLAAPSSVGFCFEARLLTRGAMRRR